MNTKTNATSSNFEMHPVESNNIAEIGYDAAKREMRVWFKPRGALYAYHDVEPSIHAGFIAAESKGRHFKDHIRNAGHKYTKLEG